MMSVVSRTCLPAPLTSEEHAAIYEWCCVVAARFSADDRDDLAMSAYVKCASLRVAIIRNPKAFYTRIARNHIVDTLRRRQYEGRLFVAGVSETIPCDCDVDVLTDVDLESYPALAAYMRGETTEMTATVKCEYLQARADGVFD